MLFGTFKTDAQIACRMTGINILLNGKTTPLVHLHHPVIYIGAG